MKKRLYYVRSFVCHRIAFIIGAAVLAILIVILIGLLIRISTAPLYTYLLFPLVYIVAVAVYLRKPHYFFIDTQTYTLKSGNLITQKEKIVAPLSSFVEVLYLPHTKEVKIKQSSGESFLKLKDGKGFVQEMETTFETFQAHLQE